MLPKVRRTGASSRLQGITSLGLEDSWLERAPACTVTYADVVGFMTAELWLALLYKDHCRLALQAWLQSTAEYFSRKFLGMRMDLLNAGYSKEVAGVDVAAPVHLVPATNCNRASATTWHWTGHSQLVFTYLEECSLHSASCSITGAFAKSGRPAALT